MATPVTLTGDLESLFPGVEVTRIKHAVLKTNLDPGQSVIDHTTGKVHFNTQPVDITNTGTFNVSLIPTNATDTNCVPNTLRYRLTVDATAGRNGVTFDSGWFTITANADIADDGFLDDAEPMAIQSASTFADSAAAASTAAAASATSAAAAADLASEITGLTGEDDAVALLVGDTGTATGAALSSTFAGVGEAKQVPPGLGNGTTDATAGIQSVIDAANTAGMAVRVPAGDYRITAPLENVRSLHLDNGARIFADAAMDAVVRTQTATRYDNGWIVGKGTIDAGTNATVGLHLRNFLYFEVSGIQITGGTIGLKLGDTGAAGRSAEAVVSNVRIIGGTVTSGSIGIEVENSGDHSLSQILIQNYEKGVYLPAAGNAMCHDIHVWTEPALGATTVSFEDHSNNSHYVQCHADTPTEYGWRLYGYQTTLVQCGTYINPTAGSATDNVVVGVKFEGTNPIATLVGHFFLGGSASKRLKADIEAADGNYGLVNVIPVVGQHTVTVRALNARAVGLTARDGVTAGQSVNADATVPTAGLGFRIRTNGLDRWRLQSDGVAEAGANAGSGLLLSRYDDAGAKLADVFAVVRTGTWIQYSSMLFGPSASIIPDGTNGLKIATNAAQKLAFFGNTPVVKPTALTATAAAAPAGGVGTAAGGWDTAVNRDAAIATINNLKSRLDGLETRLQALGLLT